MVSDGWIQYARGGENPVYFYDMRSEQPVAGLVYTPDVEDNGGLIYRYVVMASDNGIDWHKVDAPGEFGNIEANPVAQRVAFGNSVMARFIALIPTETVGQTLRADASQIRLLAPAK
jgi:hypothetical protein